MREQIAKLQVQDREREKLIQRQMALAAEQINTWYAFVEEGIGTKPTTAIVDLGCRGVVADCARQCG